MLLTSWDWLLIIITEWVDSKWIYMSTLKAFRNKITSVLSKTYTQRVLRIGYLLVPIIIIFGCIYYYRSWEHIPERNITTEITALGNCSDSSYCNFRINIDAVGRYKNNNDNAWNNCVEIGNHTVEARNIGIPDSFSYALNPIFQANEECMRKMKSFYVLRYECGTTMPASLPRKPKVENLKYHYNNFTFCYASSPQWKEYDIEKVAYGYGLIAFEDVCGMGYFKFGSNLFNKTPQMTSNWDITQSNVFLKFKSNNIRCDTISVEFFGASHFSEMYPHPDYTNMSRIEFSDSTKIKEIISNGLKFHVEFVQLKEMAATRTIILTSILSLALSLVGSIIYKHFAE